MATQKDTCQIEGKFNSDYIWQLWNMGLAEI